MKKGFIFLPLLAFAAVAPSFADTFVGSDTACFYYSGTCSPVSTVTGTGLNTHFTDFLTYTPDAGFSAGASGGTVTLGTLDVPFSFAGGVLGSTFDITLTFTAPGGGNSYSATAVGGVFAWSGGATVTFNTPTTKLFTYNGGSFDVTLPDSISIGNGDSAALTATIGPLMPATVPEPSNFGFLASGLLLIGFVAFRRRNQQFAPAQS